MKGTELQLINDGAHDVIKYSQVIRTVGVWTELVHILEGLGRDGQFGVEIWRVWEGVEGLLEHFVHLKSLK